jgi:hypothetical protein
MNTFFILPLLTYCKLEDKKGEQYYNETFGGAGETRS